MSCQYTAQGYYVCPASAQRAPQNTIEHFLQIPVVANGKCQRPDNAQIDLKTGTYNPQTKKMVYGKVPNLVSTSPVATVEECARKLQNFDNDTNMSKGFVFKNGNCSIYRDCGSQSTGNSLNGSYVYTQGISCNKRICNNINI